MLEFHKFVKKVSHNTTITHKSKILLAVSGGVDSMVLLSLFQRLSEIMHLEIQIVYIQHQLRPESQIESDFLQSYSQKNNIPFHQKVWEKHMHPSAGIEEAARNFRYASFESIMKKTQSTHLVLGHHGEDQIETILMKLTRGSSLTGISGMTVEKEYAVGKLVRPLLSYTKTEIYDYAEKENIPFFEDESNQSQRYTRNRYRHEMLPFLKAENPQVVAHFQHFSQDLQALLTLVQPALTNYLSWIQLNEETISIEKFQTLPPSIQHFILGEWLSRYVIAKEIAFKRQHIEQIQQLILSSQPNNQVQLSRGLIVKRTYDEVSLCEIIAEDTSEENSWHTLDLGNEYSLESGETLALYTTDTYTPSTGEKCIFMEPSSIRLPLIVRHRENGDRMTLKGMPSGSKKIKDIFIDLKISKELRKKAYILTDQEKKVICMLNYKESALSIPEETDKIQYILVIK